MAKLQRQDWTHVSELDQAKLAQGVDDLSSDFIRNVQLHHAHFRRAERSIARRSHGDGVGVAHDELSLGCRQRFRCTDGASNIVSHLLKLALPGSRNGAKIMTKQHNPSSASLRWTALSIQFPFQHSKAETLWFFLSFSFLQL